MVLIMNNTVSTRNMARLMSAFLATSILFGVGIPSYAQRRSSSSSRSGTVNVKGYIRKDGTYVPPHVRSAPDKSFDNNWSTKGNSNPFTGKDGTKISPEHPSPSRSVGSFIPSLQEVTQPKTNSTSLKNSGAMQPPIVSDPDLFPPFAPTGYRSYSQIRVDPPMLSQPGRSVVGSPVEPPSSLPTITPSASRSSTQNSSDQELNKIVERRTAEYKQLLLDRVAVGTLSKDVADELWEKHWTLETLSVQNSLLQGEIDALRARLLVSLNQASHGATLVAGSAPRLGGSLVETKDPIPTELPRPTALPKPTGASVETGRDVRPTRTNADANRTSDPAPELTDAMKKRQINANLRVRVTVEADGSHDEELVQGSGDDEIDALVLRTLHRWKWSPAYRDGEKASQTLTFRYRINIKD